MKDESKVPVRRWLWRSVKWLVVVAILAGLVYKVGFSPVPVLRHRVERGEIVAEVMGTGTLEARVKATISSKISGLVSKVLVDQGDEVKKGDLLVELDDEELSQQVAIAQANLAAKEAAIKRLTSDKKRSEAVLTQATQLLGRMEKAVATQAVSQTDLEKANETFAVAEAGLARAEAAIAEGQKELLSAQETLLYRKAGLDNTKVLAPFDGLIVHRQRDPGDVALPGSAILKLVSTEQLWISARVDETEMAKVNPGQAARVIFRSKPDHPYKGEVARTGREADRETREFIVDVSVLEFPENWAVGQRAEVFIEAGRKGSALLVPAEYIVWRGKQAGVFVNQGDAAAWRPVGLGLHNGDFFEGVDGLETGEELVMPLESKTPLEDGKRIAVK